MVGWGETEYLNESAYADGSYSDTASWDSSYIFIPKPTFKADGSCIVIHEVDAPMKGQWQLTDSDEGPELLMTLKEDWEDEYGSFRLVISKLTQTSLVFITGETFTEFEKVKPK